MADPERLSADGSLRYVRIPTDQVNSPMATVMLSDAATGAVYFDGIGPDEAWILAEGDTALVLHILGERLATWFRIDPRARRFWAEGEAGPGQPLTALGDAVRTRLAIPPDRRPAKRPVAWRSLVVIALTTAVGIAVGSYVVARFTPPMPALTPMPRMPGAKG